MIDLTISFQLARERFYIEGRNLAAEFELHARRGVHALAELFPLQISWYMFQWRWLFVVKFRELGVLGIHHQGPMELKQQDVAQGVKHSNNGARVGRMPTKRIKAGLITRDGVREERTQKNRLSSRAQTLWRRLSFATLAKTKSMRKKDPEWSYHTALALLKESYACKKVMQHSEFEEEDDATPRYIWTACRFIRYCRQG